MLDTFRKMRLENKIARKEEIKEGLPNDNAHKPQKCFLTSEIGKLKRKRYFLRNGERP